MHHRREFLRKSAFVSLTPLAPAFLQRSVQAAKINADGRILVVVQLDGGNDGLNTVVPFRDELYSKYRPTLRVDGARVLKLDADLGFHPEMRAAADLFEDGRLAVVQNVGYPNPSRSHFQSMAIWHHGQPDVQRHDSIGWLGRTMDVRHESGWNSQSLFVGDSELPVAIRGRRAQAAAISDASDLRVIGQPPLPKEQAIDDLTSFVSQSIESSYEVARRFEESTHAGPEAGGYPSAELGKKMKLVSRMIKTDPSTRVFYVAQSGYDTHASQQFAHGQLLSTFSNCLKAFLDDMQNSGLGEQVAVLGFSEFGRRVQENGSAGTDHGAAGPVFIAGAEVNSRLHGSKPDLSNLARGDLKHQFDFRQVYASLLHQWLRVDPTKIFESTYQELDLIRA